METQTVTTTLSPIAAAAMPDVSLPQVKFGYEPAEEFLAGDAVPLPSPRALRGEYPGSIFGREVVREGRETIQRILQRRDERFLVVVGPCSIHDPEAALEYAERLALVSKKLADRLVIVMRAYFEKPRTTVGWRGLINDPHLDGSFDMAEGLRRARRLLTRVTSLGLPVAAEMLDTTTPAYFSDLVSLAAIGARTVESQPHRALASGLPMPVGYKNGTDGGFQAALDAIVSASQPHSYVGVDMQGRPCALRTNGNCDGFLILRGGKATGPNFDPASIDRAVRQLNSLRRDTLPAVMVDCSHANSGSDPEKQMAVCASVAAQRAGGSRAIVGIMLESNLSAGKQALGLNGSDENLRYGVSVTDACLGWDDTERLLGELHRTLA